MEETKYSDDERWAIFTWLSRRKPFPTYFPLDAELYAEIVQALADMGHERSFAAIRQMLDRQFGSDLTQERVLDELRVLYERQPDNWDEPLAGIVQPRVWVRFCLKKTRCLKCSSFFVHRRGGCSHRTATQEVCCARVTRPLCQEKAGSSLARAGTSSECRTSTSCLECSSHCPSSFRRPRSCSGDACGELVGRLVSHGQRTGRVARTSNDQRRLAPVALGGMRAHPGYCYRPRPLVFLIT
jgi:hypothetical protein